MDVYSTAYMPHPWLPQDIQPWPATPADSEHVQMHSGDAYIPLQHPQDFSLDYNPPFLQQSNDPASPVHDALAWPASLHSPFDINAQNPLPDRSLNPHSLNNYQIDSSFPSMPKSSLPHFDPQSASLSLTQPHSDSSLGHPHSLPRSDNHPEFSGPTSPIPPVPSHFDPYHSNPHQPPLNWVPFPQSWKHNAVNPSELVVNGHQESLSSSTKHQSQTASEIDAAMPLAGHSESHDFHPSRYDWRAPSDDQSLALNTHRQTPVQTPMEYSQLVSGTNGTYAVPANVQGNGALGNLSVPNCDSDADRIVPRHGHGPGMPPYATTFQGAAIPYTPIMVERDDRPTAINPNRFVRSSSASQHRLRDDYSSQYTGLGREGATDLSQPSPTNASTSYNLGVFPNSLHQDGTNDSQHNTGMQPQAFGTHTLPVNNAFWPSTGSPVADPRQLTISGSIHSTSPTNDGRRLQGSFYPALLDSSMLNGALNKNGGSDAKSEVGHGAPTSLPSNTVVPSNLDPHLHQTTSPSTLDFDRISPTEQYKKFLVPSSPPSNKFPQSQGHTNPSSLLMSTNGDADNIGNATAGNSKSGSSGHRANPRQRGHSNAIADHATGGRATDDKGKEKAGSSGSSKNHQPQANSNSSNPGEGTVAPTRLIRKRDKSIHTHIACTFCRRRKIACIPGPSEDRDIGPCMPCSKRDLVCSRPPFNKRGQRRKDSEATEDLVANEDSNNGSTRSYVQGITNLSIRDRERGHKELSPNSSASDEASPITPSTPHPSGRPSRKHH